MAKDKQDNASVEELRALADRTRGFFSTFRMLSGSFRTRVVSGLDSAAKREEEYAAFKASRTALQEALEKYRQALKQSRADFDEKVAATTEALQRANETEQRILEVQERALGLEQRAKDLAEEDRRLLELSETLGSTHEAGQELLLRLEAETKSQADLLRDAQDAQARIHDHLTWTQNRAAELDEAQEAVQQQLTELAEREGALSIRETTERERRTALEEQNEELRGRIDHATELLDRVQVDERRVQEIEERLATQLETVRELQEQVQAHETTIEQRRKEQDDRESQLHTRSTALDDRKLALDQERLSVDERIAELGDLSKRDERLLQTKAHLDEEKKRLDAAFDEVRGNQRHTLDTWEQLKETLARLETLETRVQDTFEKANAVREETERRAREHQAADDERTKVLDERARELEMWRLNAQLRERQVQEKYRGLEELEQKKERVRRQIEKLELAQAERVAAFDREQARQRSLWAERRAEAEKARELYERNVARLDARVAQITEREEEHRRRGEELEAREQELARRRREIEALELTVETLREQRDSLQVTVAGLTAAAGEGAGRGIGKGIAFDEASRSHSSEAPPERGTRPAPKKG